MIVVSDFDETDEPIIPEGFRELVSIWRLQDIIGGLKQLEGIEDFDSLIHRLIKYFKNGA